jgi:hypothetical protein
MAKTTRPIQPTIPTAVAASSQRDALVQASGRGACVLAWRDHLAGTTLRRPRPRLAAAGLAIEGPTPLPGEHQPGSPGFGYWASAEALGRAVSVWRDATDPAWERPAGNLAIRLASGAHLPICYDRAGIVLGRTGEPGPACRAMGHAVLDALFPALWDTAAEEVAVFHHAFADVTAVLAALEMPECRDDVLGAGSAGLAEALRALSGRSASRMTPPLLDMLALLVRTTSGRGRSADAVLCLAAAKAARLLATAVRRVAVVPNFLAQVASELTIATMETEPSAVAVGLRDLFAQAGLLPRNPATDGLNPYEAEDGTERVPPRPAPSWVAIDAAFLGLDRPLLVQPAAQTPLLAVARDGSGADPTHPITAARHFALALFAQGRVEGPDRGPRRARRFAPDATHRLVDEGAALRLCRLRFPCG